MLGCMNLDVEDSFIILCQVAFDVLLNKYEAESPQLTLNQYCEKHIFNVAFEKKDGNQQKTWNVISSEDDKSRTSESSRKWMKSAIAREVSIMKNPALINEINRMGIDSERYLDKREKLNNQFEEEEKKTKFEWDQIYYNGHPGLFTAMQFKRSINKKNRKTGKPNNNYSNDKVGDFLSGYDDFVKFSFAPKQEENNCDFFNRSMRFYCLESYKRIDYMYKLSVKMDEINIRKIEKNNRLVRRFHPPVVLPIERKQEDSCILEISDKVNYYRPILFLEKKWLKSCGAYNEKDNLVWYYSNTLRAMVVELFKYNYEFVSSDFDDMADFIRKNYNILAYHDTNKEWVKKDGNITRVKNAKEINDALFWDSEKRTPVKD